MKNKLSTIMILMLLILSMFLFSGCKFLDSDNDSAERNLKELINKIQSRDRNEIKGLFATNVVTSIEGFDESIDELFAYFNGDYVSHISGGLGSEYDKNDGVSREFHNMSYDITTTVQVYRVALVWYMEDTGDANNIGIWSSL